jgi:hypothetical protein
LFTLESAVRLQFDCFDLVIRVLEEEPFCSFSDSHKTACAQNREQSHFPKHAHRAPNAVLRRSAGTNFHIEQMLLPTLSHIGEASIARSGSSLAKAHPLPFVLARP